MKLTIFLQWMNYGFTFIPHSDVSWRFPLAFQCFFAIVTIALVLVTPESPRWLVMRGRVSEARNILSRLLAKPEDDPAVIDEIQNLVATVHHEAEVQQPSILKEIFASNNKQQTFRRMLLGAGTAFFQQMGGTNVIAYYLPVVLTRSVGLSNRMTLILSAVDSMSLMFWGSLASLVIDRVGRKRLMLMGVTGSSICFALVAVGLRYGGVDNKGMSILAVVFIFMYYVFYGLSLLSIPYMYPAEINSQKMRNIGTSFAIFNVCFVPIIWRFYVETANLSLEQVDRLFEVKHEAGKNMSWSEATRIARTETPVGLGDAKAAEAEHCENVA